LFGIVVVPSGISFKRSVIGMDMLYPGKLTIII